MYFLINVRVVRTSYPVGQSLTSWSNFENCVLFLFEMLLKVFKKLYTFQPCLKSDKKFNEIIKQMLSKLQVFKTTYNCFFLTKNYTNQKKILYP